MVSDSDRAASEAIKDEIRRLIGNQFYEAHPFKSGRSGMEDFGRITELVTHVDDVALGDILTRCDQLLAKQEGCTSCYCKLCAFLEYVSRRRLPGKVRHYRRLYAAMHGDRDDRDYRTEVVSAIRHFGAQRQSALRHDCCAVNFDVVSSCPDAAKSEGL